MRPDLEHCQAGVCRVYVENHQVVHRTEPCGRRPKVVIAVAEAGWAIAVCRPCLVRARNKMVGLFKEHKLEDKLWN